MANNKKIILNSFGVFGALTVAVTVLGMSFATISNLDAASKQSINGESVINVLQNTKGYSGIYTFSTSSHTKGTWSIVSSDDSSEFSIDQNIDSSYNEKCRISWKNLTLPKLYSLTLKFTPDSNTVIYTKNVKIKVLTIEDITSEKFKIIPVDETVKNDTYTLNYEKDFYFSYKIINTSDSSAVYGVSWELECLNFDQEMVEKEKFFGTNIHENILTINYLPLNATKQRIGSYQFKLTANFINTSNDSIIPVNISSKYITVNISSQTYFAPYQKIIFIDLRNKENSSIKNSTISSASYFVQEEKTGEKTYSPLNNSEVIVKLENGENLPSWLSFDYKARKFNFIPDNVPSSTSTYNVKLIWKCIGYDDVFCNVKVLVGNTKIMYNASETTSISISAGDTKNFNLIFSNTEYKNRSYSVTNDKESDKFIDNSISSTGSLSIKMNSTNGPLVNVTAFCSDPTNIEEELINPNKSSLGFSSSILVSGYIFNIEGPSTIFASANTSYKSSTDSNYKFLIYETSKQATLNSTPQVKIINTNNSGPEITIPLTPSFDSGNNTTAYFYLNDFTANKNPGIYDYEIQFSLNDVIQVKKDMKLIILDLYQNNVSTTNNVFKTNIGSSSTKNQVSYDSFKWTSTNTTADQALQNKEFNWDINSGNFYKGELNTTLKNAKQNNMAYSFHTYSLDMLNSTYKENEDLTIVCNTKVDKYNFKLEKKINVSYYKYQINGAKTIFFNQSGGAGQSSKQYGFSKVDTSAVNITAPSYTLEKFDNDHNLVNNYFSFNVNEGKIKMNTIPDIGSYKTKLYLKNDDKKAVAQIDLTIYVVNLKFTRGANYKYMMKEKWETDTAIEFGNENYSNKTVVTTLPTFKKDNTPVSSPYYYWSWNKTKNGTNDTITDDFETITVDYSESVNNGPAIVYGTLPTKLTLRHISSGRTRPDSDKAGIAVHLIFHDELGQDTDIFVNTIFTQRNFDAIFSDFPYGLEAIVAGGTETNYTTLKFHMVNKEDQGAIANGLTLINPNEHGQCRLEPGYESVVTTSDNITNYSLTFWNLSYPVKNSTTLLVKKNSPVTVQYLNKYQGTSNILTPFYVNYIDASSVQTNDGSCTCDETLKTKKIIFYVYRDASGNRKCNVEGEVYERTNDLSNIDERPWYINEKDLQGDNGGWKFQDNRAGGYTYIRINYYFTGSKVGFNCVVKARGGTEISQRFETEV